MIRPILPTRQIGQIAAIFAICHLPSAISPLHAQSIPVAPRRIWETPAPQISVLTATQTVGYPVAHILAPSFTVSGVTNPSGYTFYTRLLPALSSAAQNISVISGTTIAPTINLLTPGTNLIAFEVRNGSYVSSNTFTIVSIPTLAPTVAFASPDNGAVFLAPQNILLEASPTDADGSIAAVTFYTNDVPIVTVTAAPWRHTLSNLLSGAYTILAVAKDNLGVTNTAPAAISITLTNTPSNIPPLATLDAPLNNASYNTPHNLVLTASASDADGSITSVKLQTNEVTFLDDTAAPYTATVSSIPAGQYRIRAIATDNGGLLTTSTVATVNIITPAGNSPPTVSITAPAHSQSFGFAPNIAITASASDSDGTISQVVFKDNATVLNTDTTAPYAYTLSAAAAGPHSFSAEATDNSGAVTVSASIPVTVAPAPTATITSPTNSQTFNTNVNIAITATASGATTNVAFYATVAPYGTVLIGNDPSSPYSIVTNTPPIGAYSVFARATDNFGISADSPAVSFTVAYPPVTGGTNYYVATTGSDANPGTLSQPFLTIGKAVSLLGPNITAIVRAGTYDWNNNGAIPGGTSWAAPVGLVAYPGERPILRPTSSPSGRVLHFGNGTLSGSAQKFIVIDGFVIDGIHLISYPGGDTVKITDSASNIEIRNCEIKNAANQGILVITDGTPTGQCVFRNLDIHHIGQHYLNAPAEQQKLEHGIYLAGSSNLVENCHLHDLMGHGVHIYANQPYNNYNTVKNSFFYNCATAGGADTLGAYNGTGHQLLNNIIWQSGGSAIRIQYNAYNVIVAHNTIWKSYSHGIYYPNDGGDASSGLQLVNNLVSDCLGYGIWLKSTHGTAFLTNNLAWNNAITITDSDSRKNFRDDSVSATTLASNIGFGLVPPYASSADPKFIAPLSANLRLQSGSAAEDTGFTLPLLPADYAGPIPTNTATLTIPKTRATPPEIGAYER
jgi:hypothetical protein